MFAQEKFTSGILKHVKEEFEKGHRHSVDMGGDVAKFLEQHSAVDDAVNVERPESIMRRNSIMAVGTSDTRNAKVLEEDWWKKDDAAFDRMKQEMSG